MPKGAIITHGNIIAAEAAIYGCVAKVKLLFFEKSKIYDKHLNF